MSKNELYIFNVLDTLVSHGVKYTCLCCISHHRYHSHSAIVKVPFQCIVHYASNLGTRFDYSILYASSSRYLVFASADFEIYPSGVKHCTLLLLMI